jgi:outer membrane protein OmpA-like peptidoglycan-associated protein
MKINYTPLFFIALLGGCAIAPPAPMGFNRVPLPPEPPARQALGIPMPVVQSEQPTPVPLVRIALPALLPSVSPLPAVPALPALPVQTISIGKAPLLKEPSTTQPAAQDQYKAGQSSTRMSPAFEAAPSSSSIQLLFAYASATPDKSAVSQIKNLVANFSSLDKVLIVGKTDNTGLPTLNRVLAQRRADAIRALARSMGVPESRIFTSTCSDCLNSRPDTETNRAANRAVQFDVVRNKK